MKKILFLLLFVSNFFVFGRSAQAKDFSSFNKVAYEFSSSSDAYVTQEISLVNLVPSLYVSQYSLSIMGGEISEVTAFDKVGPVKVESTKKGETTIITLEFNEAAVGKDKVLSFIIKYKISGLAKHEGNLWQISVPKLVNSESIDEFQLHLKVPADFGKISVVNPSPKETKQENGFYVLNFDKNDLTNFGVMATFGQYQTYDFRILYNLSNDSGNLVIEKITIPPDTNYQTVFNYLITPEPVDVRIDAEGNWEAYFDLSPNSQKQIEVTGKVNVFSQSKKKESSLELDKDYLKSTKYWNTADKRILALASELKTPENIYKYVVKTLKYDYANVKKGLARTGSIDALERPTFATCTQFTDLFIAICRAAGIPCREVEGYAYSGDAFIDNLSKEIDLLHSWPEYFDKDRGEWIMVDPTFGNTTGGIDFFNKFDMSHFAFVIHGRSDIAPPPPGSFKSESDESKQIFVNLGNENQNLELEKIDIEEVNPAFSYSIKKSTINFKLINASRKAVYSQKLTYDGNLYLKPSEWYFDAVPPYGRFGIDFIIFPQEKFKDFKQDFSFIMGETKIKYRLSVVSLALRLCLLIGVTFSIVLVVLLKSMSKSKKLQTSNFTFNKDK